MKFATVLVVVAGVSILCSGQKSSESNGVNKTAHGPRAMCDAAASKLRETRTNQVVLVMTISAEGHVRSFETEAPKGLRLETIKEAAHEIKAMRFDPATKDGKPVMVMIRAAFQCP